jgi:beta propeller repeat protein
MGKNNLIILGFIFGIFLFLSGCVGPIECNKPYIVVGNECCLDKNDNAICDTDETMPANQTGNITGNQTGNETQVTENITPDTVNGTQETGNATPLCNPPYYEYKIGDCCLDTDSNLICDKDEIAPPANQTGNGQAETGNESEGGIYIMPTAYCGDDTCNSNETSSTCCKDCGCPSGKICFVNTCTDFKGFKTPEIKAVSFCGDGYCSANENSSNCCIDCDCPTGMSCNNNTCTSFLKIKPVLIMPIHMPEKKLTNDTVTDLAKPRVSDYFVVWNEYFDGDSDIMLYNLQTNSRERIATPSTQYNADIYGKRLVWTDYRRPVGDNSDIYYYDLVSGTEGFITSRIEYKYDGAIDGNYAAWIEQDGYNHYVYLFDLVSSTEKKLTTSSIEPTGVDISGTNVVYGYYDCDGGTCTFGIKLYNTITKTTSSIISTPGDIDTYTVRIYGNKVAYIAGDDQYTQVNVYDTSSKITTQITSATGEKRYPSIYNNTVVWMDKRNGNWDIYMYDLLSKKETALVTESHDQKYPDIYGNKVAYIDYRDGRHIYMYTLSN